MSKHSQWIVRIRHMVKAIEDIQNHVRDMNQDDFYHDIKTLHAVERCLQILGEASKYTPEEIKKKYADIPWQEIKKTRNFITHLYDDVQENVLWETIQKDLPPLKLQLERIVNDHDSGLI
jgi:uncharacterized protein with HEPN domain